MVTLRLVQGYGNKTIDLIVTDSRGDDIGRIPLDTFQAIELAREILKISIENIAINQAVNHDIGIAHV